MRGRAFLLLSVAVFWLACEHAQAPPETSGVPRPIPDAKVEGAIRRALSRDAALRSELISVSVTSGKVTLAGSVQSLPERRRAAQLVGSLWGPSSLANSIVVTPSSRPDGEIAQDVNEAIRRDTATRTARATATANGAIVTIRGSADSSNQREDLTEIASRVPGVKDVILTVDVPREYRGDSEIAVEVRDRLGEDARLDETRVRVAVNDRTVSLSGVVGSLFQHDAAVADAWAAGVVDVDAHALLVDWSAGGRGRGAAGVSPCP